MNRILLAGVLNASPTSSAFRETVMASYRYGLTEGNYRSETIALTAVGTSATRPRADNERVAAERQALRHVPVFDQLLTHFANSKLPEPQFLGNAFTVSGQRRTFRAAARPASRDGVDPRSAEAYAGFRCPRQEPEAP
jgi:hypothetical protein